MQKNTRDTEAMLKRLIVFTAVLILLILNADTIFDFLMRIVAICSPFLIGAGMAFIFNIVANGLMKYGGKFFRFGESKGMRVLCNILSILLVFSIAFGFIVLVIPQLVDSVQSILERLPEAADSLYQWALQVTAPVDALHDPLVNMGSSMANLDHLSEVLPEVFGWIFSGGANNIFDSIYSAVSTTFSYLTSFVIALMFSIILLFNKRSFVNEVKSLLRAYLSDEHYYTVAHVSDIVKRTFTSYIAGTSCECLILGTLVWLGCTIFRIPYAILTGIIVAIGAYVPMFGALISAFVAAVFIAVENPMSSITFLIMFIVIQQIEGNFIYPNVVGKSVGLPPMYVCVAVTLGGSLAGIIGMVIFIPICSCIYQLAKEDVSFRLKKKEDAGSKV